MRSLIKTSIATTAVVACLVTAATPLVAARSASAPAACATDKDFHPDDVFFAKQCVRFNRDGTCARYRVITCNKPGGHR